MRRSPHQARAVATVEAILDGAARVLVSAGFDGITTNGVATAAGVSIGSLYQYFSNKEELVNAMMERHHARVKALVSDGLREYAGAPADAMITGLIRIILEAQSTDRELYRAMRQQIPRDSRFFKLHEVLDFITELVAMALAARKEELGIGDPYAAAFYVVNAVDGILEAALRRGPPAGDGETLIQEISTLVIGYLKRASQVAPPA